MGNAKHKKLREGDPVEEKWKRASSSKKLRGGRRSRKVRGSEFFQTRPKRTPGRKGEKKNDARTKSGAALWKSNGS